jgi:hypothetical protein
VPNRELSAGNEQKSSLAASLASPFRILGRPSLTTAAAAQSPFRNVICGQISAEKKVLLNDMIIAQVVFRK